MRRELDLGRLLRLIRSGLKLKECDKKPGLGRNTSPQYQIENRRIMMNWYDDKTRLSGAIGFIRQVNCIYG